MPAIDSYTADGFARWALEFKLRARAQGIPDHVFENIMADLRLLPKVIEKDRNQAEFTRTLWDYLDRAVSEERIANGQQAQARHQAMLAQIESRFGVDRHVLVAIWGLESAYGALRGDIPTLSALATLAYDGRRGAFFESELMALLRIIADGIVTKDQAVGSWAGAMGHTQFMPSSYRTMAADFAGGGAPDIWGDDPGDALALTAAYLARSGWKLGLPWGVEVILPPDFDYNIAGNRTQRPAQAWRAMGVARADGTDLPDAWGAVILPAGARGPAFWISDNFAAIETYNRADSYVIAVGHLSDRLQGGKPFVQEWPRDLRALTGAERREFQRRLGERGLYAGEADGRFGPLTVTAIKALQRQLGRIPDGYASAEMLDLLK